MAILSDIRKRPIFLVLIIGLALFAFVLSSVLKGNGGPSRTNIGEINGEEITAQEFARRVDAQKSRGASANTMQTVNSVWNQMVQEKVYDEQINNAGIVVGEKDLWDAIVNIYKNSPNFQNEAGIFDENKLKEYIATLKDDPRSWQNWENTIENIKKNLKQTQYNNLIKAGLTANIKDGEREYYQNNKKHNVQFAYKAFASEKDVKVSDDEIKAYVKSHPDQFKVDPNVELEFVKFEVKPSKEDIANVRKEVEKLISDHEEYNANIKQNIKVEGFKTVKDNESFVNEYSDLAYVDKNYFKEDLPQSTFDTLMKVDNNTVLGPIKEGDYFKLYKKISNEDVKSVKASHILFSYKGAQSAKPTITRTKEEAKKEAEKLLKKVNAKNFADMAKEFSDGPSGVKGGELGDFARKGKFVKEFEEFIFANPKGKIGIVETPFGFHIIKVDDVKTDKALKLAIVSRKIDPSTKTESDIYQKAETLASDIESGKKVEELVKTDKYQIKKANNIKELDERITGLGNQRDIVRWAFDKDTKEGSVKRFDLNDGNYAVIILKKKYNKALNSLAIAKPKVKPILLKEKRAKAIKAKISGNTIEEKAKSLSTSVSNANEVSIINPKFGSAGTDETVAAALLYLKEGDVKVIDGKNGVFVIKVIKVIEPFDVKKYSTFSDNITKSLQAKTNKVFEALKEKSEIEDNRASFY